MTNLNVGQVHVEPGQEARIILPAVAEEQVGHVTHRFVEEWKVVRFHCIEQQEDPASVLQEGQPECCSFAKMSSLYLII